MTAGHHNRPRIYELPHNLFMIKESLRYEWTLELIPQRVTIKASEEEPFIFDGASIPVIATFISWLIPFLETIYPMGVHIYATAFHDWMFKYQGRLPIGSHEKFVDGEWVDAGHVWSFTECNRFFGRLMKEDGTGKNERMVMQASVQSLIGWINFKKGKIPDDARPAA